jgi:DNA polymerase
MSAFEPLTGDQLIYVADSSNIEARMLAWTAGQDNLLTLFRNSGDVYSDFATKLFGFEVNKFDHPHERFIGKVCVLGLGYGMGWEKFMNTLAAGALGGPPVVFNEGEARNAVGLYRASNYAITAYWKQADQAIIDMYLGNSRQWGPLTVHKNCLVMPNGMALQYPGLRAIEPSDDGAHHDGWEYWNGKFWTKIYGGKLVENITQALARIVLFDQMLDINDLFLPHDGRVALNVHDEIIAVGPSFGIQLHGYNAKQKEIWVDSDGADSLFAEMLTIMRSAPDWCADLPLDGEGGFAFSYSK